MTAGWDWEDQDDDEPDNDYDDDPDDGEDYDPDPDYDDDPPEPDWGYEAWRAEYEEHCIQAHDGADCDCRPPLRIRIAERFRAARRRIAGHSHRRYSDEPPF